MLVKGADCSILIKTTHRAVDVPYSDETLREAVSVLQEEASIEGDGVCRGIRNIWGVTGCVVTPLTIETVPLLLYLAMGAVSAPLFVSETRNLYQYFLDLLPTEDTDRFDVIQDRGSERKLYEGCRVQGFELRVMRGETIKLKLDICGSERCQTAEVSDTVQEVSSTERFSGDFCKYRINGKVYSNIYGITLVSRKKGGTMTEIWIKRALQKETEIPSVIEDFTFTAQLLRDSYEIRQFGTFHITLKRLVLMGDETEISTADSVIGLLRFYVAGGVSAEVFTSGEDFIA